MKNDSLYFSLARLVEYIEDSLKERIVLDDLSGHVNISKFHLNRIFSSLSKTSLMNYVKNRKLSSSINELLLTDLRISDISQEYGFGYEQSYIRSFKNSFGISPEKYRKERPALRIKDKINMNYIKEISDDGIAMEHPIFIVPEFYVVGPRYKILKTDDELTEVANKLGNDFFYNRRHEVENAVNPDVYIGFVENDSEDQPYNYYTPSVQVSSPRKVPEGMVCHRIPTNKYASFEYIGLHHARKVNINDLTSTFRYIYGEWFPKSGYRQCAPYHFERIDERSTRDDYCEMEFYIPVESK